MPFLCGGSVGSTLDNLLERMHSQQYFDEVLLGRMHIEFWKKSWCVVDAGDEKHDSDSEDINQLLFSAIV